MEPIGSIYTEVSDNFQKGIIGGGIFRCVKAEKHDLGVVMADVKIIGQMDNTIDHTFESANRVYDVGGVAPTMNTCGGGGLQPKIIDEPKCLNSKGGRGGIDGLQPSVQDRVYSVDGISTSITTSFMPSIFESKNILEANSIRMVRTEEGKALRKQYENHEIHHGFNEHREPELRKDGVTNTLSTVQKDNYICVAMRGRNPTNPSDRTPGIELEQTLEVNGNGTSNCLTSVQKDNLVLGNVIIGGEQKHQSVKKDGVCTCLTSSMGTGGGYVPMIAPQYRIRKLTPKECWRLMDFSDEDFEKAAEVNSNTQLYKQAGNSIICNVLVAILGQLIEGKEDAYRKV